MSKLKKYGSPPQCPLSFRATPQSIKQENQKICDSTQAVLDRIANTVSPSQASFDNVLRPIADWESQRQLVTGVLNLLLKVSDDIKLRDAAADAEKERSQLMVDHGSRDDIFQLVDYVFRKNEVLDAESRKFLLEERRDFIRNGLLLPSQKDKSRLKEVQKRLGTITADFVRNLDEEDAHIWFAIDQLVGVPDDVLRGLEHGTGEWVGKVKVRLEGPDFTTVIKFARLEHTRRDLYTARVNKSKLNIPLFVEAILLRHEAATILGYANHAAYKLEIKMAKTPEAVTAFLGDLRNRAERHIKRDIDELLMIKRKEVSSLGDPIQSEIELYKWDVSYYTRVLQEQEYSVDHLKISEYFPLQTTIKAMLSVFGNLFGFVFYELKDDDRTRLSPTGDGRDLTWHEDVILYSVWDDEKEGGDFAGYLYLDLHPRPGKYGGAQCHPVQLGFNPPGGRRHYPSTALIANFSKSAFLKHSDMMMLFHELGHGVHDLSGRCQYSRFHGAETVSDFNEAPSQMLENWCWNRTGLRQLSSHYETGQPLPDDMIDALLRTKHVQASMTLVQQLRVFLFDMAVHSTPPDESGKIDVEKIWSEYVDLGGVKGPEDKHWYASMKHLFMGYDAGFYSYLWSKAHAMDMFDAAFRKDVSDSVQGRRYRHMVLEKGGSQDEMLTLEEFLGRSPKPDAFLKDLNLN